MSAAFGSAGDRPFTAYTCSPFHSRACGRAEPSPRLPARNPQAAGPVGSARKACLSNPPVSEPKQTDLRQNLRDRPVLGGERAAFDERVDLVAPIDRRRRQHVPVNERLRANKRKAPPRACARARARVAQTCDWGQVGPSHADGSTSRAFTGGLRLSPSGPTGRVG